ncbi:MAG: DNA topoisomerase III [Spirochaetales bacterium]|nr:DNA topoisomerase III [Spirochaetales bacterium]
MKTIVLAEKPSVGKDLARVLKCTNMHKEYIEGERYIVTWALGHLVTLAEPEDYDRRYREWRLEYLPMLPDRMRLKVIPKTSHQFNVIKRLLSQQGSDRLVIATDAGREGELVARWILKLCGWKKPVQRLWISSQTDRAIREGFARLKPGSEYENLFMAAVCRSEADWLVGLNVTRAMTCKLNAQFTAGRVQTPTLALIVEREEEIRNFVPKDYRLVYADFDGYSGLWKNARGESRLFDEAKAEEIVRKVRGGKGVVVDCRRVEKKEYPPLAYDLTELQRDANRRFGFSAKKTLSLLQILYERYKLVTYPRTDSRHITEDMVPTLPERLHAIAVPPYKGIVQPLLAKNPQPGGHFVDNTKVSDHHAIIPTEQRPALEKLSGDEKRIYDLIVRRFIAVLYPPHRYMQTDIVTEVNGERFYSKGRETIDKGFRIVTSGYESADDEASGDDEERTPLQQVGVLKKGDIREVKNCRTENRKTQPPPRYTEATLLTAMEHAGRFIEEKELKESIKGCGIGTPATRAEIIEKLFYNNYTERHGKTIFPTNKGKKLIELVPDQLKSPRLTAEWEQRLSRIEKGGEKAGRFMEDIRKNTVSLVNEVRSINQTYTPDNVTSVPCPLCGKHMLSMRGKRGRMLVCQDRECGFRQPEKRGDGKWFEKSKAERIRTKKLIETYTDTSDESISFGDLLKKAMENKKKKKQ